MRLSIAVFFGFFFFPAAMQRNGVIMGGGGGGVGEKGIKELGRQEAEDGAGVVCPAGTRTGLVMML